MKKRRVKRDYRQNTPGKFHSFIQKVKHCLTNNLNYPDTTWGGNVAVRQLYFEKVDAYDLAYRLASNGDRALIRDRDKLMEEIVEILDEIASLLEAASVRNPDALFTTGFNVTLERRSHNRTKLPLMSPNDLSIVNLGEPRKAVASASTMPGVYNHEIHLNTKDPSVEEYWFHKSMYPEASRMVMEDLEPGNTFVRMRHHGPDGPGPWSAIVSIMIT